MKLLLAVLVALPLCAQTLNFNLDRLAEKAKEKVEITLEGELLEAAKKLKPELAEQLKDITRVYVRTFEFEQPGAYTDADLAPVRAAASGAGWSKVISAKEDGESVDISVYTEAGEIRGLLLIAAEAKELAVIHIQGSVTLARMQEVVASSVSFDLKSIAELQGQ